MMVEMNDVRILFFVDGTPARGKHARFRRAEDTRDEQKPNLASDDYRLAAAYTCLLCLHNVLPDRASHSPLILRYQQILAWLSGHCRWRCIFMERLQASLQASF
jgi:hypothetical protein